MPSHQVPAVDRRECPTLQIHVYFPSKVPFLSTQKKSLAVPLILRRSMLLQTGSGPLRIRAPAYMHASEKNCSSGAGVASGIHIVAAVVQP